MIFYDFEVFQDDWLVVLKNPEKRTRDVIVNNPEKLTKYYEEHKEDIWVGYNSRGYDQFILKGIICGFNPKKINDWIIVKGKSGWQFSSLFFKVPLLNYDVMTTYHSLKQLEGFMGVNIKESSVPFDIPRKLTNDEIRETIKYCESDVDNLIEVFLRRIKDFQASINLINTFKLPITNISRTKAQISAIILGCEKTPHDDEWNISFIPTIKLKKYAYVKDWFENNKGDYSKNLETTIAGVPHVFGWGGLHGAKEKYHTRGLIIHVDVNSFYPSIMIEYNLLTRNCKDSKKYKDIYEYRLKLKREGKKKEQAPYKIVLNATYGICKDKYSLAYDPLQANNVCINGQLLLLDLIEKLEKINGFELIQSNTDGLIVKIPDNDESFNQLDDICFEWEHRTRMGLGFDYIKEIWQKDVNNYVFTTDEYESEWDGLKLENCERKGSYVKELNELDNDLPIVNKALIDYMVNDIPVEKTINECNELIMFQQIARASSKYKCLVHGEKVLNEKTVRVFASKDSTDKGLYKQKYFAATLEKVASTPLNCFFVNGDIRGVKVPPRLDKSWYVDLTKKRIKDYGL